MTSTSYLFLIIFLSSFLLCSCGTRSLEDFREEGEAITLALIQELSVIHTRDQLVRSSPKLKGLFADLVDVIIDAQKYRERHPSLEVPELSPHNHLVSNQLRSEMNRIYRLPGARPLLEKCQEEALLRLDAFEKQMKKRQVS